MNDESFERVYRIYVQNRETEAIPLKFYKNTSKHDINQAIQEAINNLKYHEKNQNLKAWQGSECIENDKDWSKYKDSIVLSENPPPITTVTPPKDILNSKVEKNSHKSNEEQLFFLNGKITQSPNMHKVQSKPKSQQPEESITLNSPNKSISQPTNVTSPRKERPRSAVRTQLGLQKAQIESIHTFKNEELKPNSSNHKQEVSITFNPLKGQSFIVDQSSVSSHLFKSNLANTFVQTAQDNSQIIQNENAFEEIKALTSSTPKKVVPKQKTGEIATTPIDKGNNPFIYSYKKGFSPFSYMIETGENKFNEKLPPPVYLNYETLSAHKDYSKAAILKGLEITNNGELKLVDEEILKQQKGILTEVLSSLIKSIAEGRGVVGVSLPVRIFEPRSLLERICDFWTFIPSYIVPAAQNPDPVERMKKVISAAIGGMYVSAKQLKPFNPLLGETFQAVFPDYGITIDSEHTSHHPPIANFMLKHKDFTFWGKYEFLARVEGLTKNVVIMHQKGPNHVDFKDGHRITYYLPFLYLEGVTHGDRICKYTHYMKFVDEKNKIKAIVKFGDSGEHKAFPKKRVDAFHGKIYKYKPDAKLDKKENKNDDINYADLQEEICSLYGSYFEYLKIDGKETWNIDKNKPAQYIPVKDPLPSDARYREDLIWVKRNDKKYAHEWKLKLEERQRYEKKLRMDYQKKVKKS